MGLSVGPFLLQKSLSSGGMGEVWRARLNEGGPEVAIKLLMNERLVDERFLSAFEREVRAVSGLVHSQVVRVYDYGLVTPEEAEKSDGLLQSGLPWLAMEMANGGALTPHCGKLAPDECISVLLGLLRCLAHAHSHDVIHRDLKPGNVLLRRPGKVSQAMMLTDFGLAHITQRGFQAEALEGGWLGTTSYMAPEQFDLDASRVGPWTDLYGFGCLAWALICGKAPFSHLESPNAIRVAQILHEPPAFEPLIDLPLEVEDWLRRLLHKKPECRFAWAIEAAEALKKVVEGKTLQVYNFPEPHPDWRSYRVGELSHELKALGGTGLGLVGIRAIPMIGREDERDFLWSALGDTMESVRPSAVLLEGPAGCGKSRLASWLGERAEEELGAVRIKAEYGPLPGAEDGILPSINRHWLLEEEQFEGRTAAERYTQIVDRLRFFCHFDRPEDGLRPVVLWLDNLQWGLDGIAFVQHLMNHRDEVGLPVLVLMTSRRESLVNERVIRSLVDELMTREGCSSLAVESLPQEHRSTLIRELLGLEASLAAEVERRTGGIPHFTFQLVEDWVERGLLDSSKEGFRLKEGATAELPDDLYSVWMSRIERVLGDLPTGDGVALEMGAMMGHRVQCSEWRETCYKASCPPSPDFIPTLQSAGLIEVAPDGASWSFANAMVAECLVRLAKENGRWAYQNRICAEILEEADGPLNAERRGLHLLAAEEWEESLEPLLLAAVSRRDRSDYHVAVQLLDARDGAMDRLQLPELDRRRVHSWVDRARLARAEQRLDAAEQWVERARRVVELGQWADMLRRVEREAAYNALTRGNYPEATSIMEKTLGQAELENDHEIVGACHLGLVTARMSRGLIDEAIVHAQAALAVFEQSRSWSGQGHAYRGLGWAFLTQGKLDLAREKLLVAQECYTKAELKSGLAQVRNDLGEVYRLQGAYGLAESLYRSSIGLYRSIGAAQMLTPRVNLAFSLLEQNRTDECSVLLEDCLEAARQQGRRSFEASTHLGLALCNAKQAYWDKAMAHVVWGRLTLEESGLRSVENARILEETGRLALGVNERSLAKECLDGAHWHWSELQDEEGVRRVEGLLNQ